MSTPDVTLLGVGKMGAAAVERWVAAGRTVAVWNRTPEKAEALQGPRVTAEQDLPTAVRGVSVVATLLTNGSALRSVLLDGGALEAMDRGSTLVDLSTVDVASSTAVAEAAAKHGVRYVRGAVSGTPAVVRSGSAGLLLSGPADAVEAASDLLRDITPSHVVVGEAEQARVVKLATNMLLAGTMGLLAEAVVMGEASGVERDVLFTALDSTVISSRFLGYKSQALLARDYQATFTTADMSKDVVLALEQAEAAGVPMPVTQSVGMLLEQACDSGWAEDDFLSLVRLVQSEAGQPVDAPDGRDA